jgi:hypothetical protein
MGEMKHRIHRYSHTHHPLRIILALRPVVSPASAFGFGAVVASCMPSNLGIDRTVKGRYLPVVYCSTPFCMLNFIVCPSRCSLSTAEDARAGCSGSAHLPEEPAHAQARPPNKGSIMPCARSRKGKIWAGRGSHPLHCCLHSAVLHVGDAALPETNSESWNTFPRTPSMQRNPCPLSF